MMQHRLSKLERETYQRLQAEMDRTMKLMSLDECERLLRAFEADLAGQPVDDADHTSPAQLVSLQAAGRFFAFKAQCEANGITFTSDV